MKTAKLAFILCLVAILMFSSVSMAAGKLKIAMVTDVGGLGDQSFNDAAYKGLLDLKAEYGVDIKVLESSKMEDYVPNLTQLVNDGYDMIWAIGFLMKDALAEVAEEYPDAHFGLIDDVVDLPNVVSITFKEQEGSFLVGLIAATDTRTNAVGFVGGMEFPLIQKFEAGYKAGVKAANPGVRFLSAYAGKFDDPAKGKELANAQFTNGADIVYHAAGATGLGVIEAAKEKGAGYYAIGVDMCQHHISPADVKACMVKRVDVGIVEGTKPLIVGSFEGGHKILGLAENGVGVCDDAVNTASAKALSLVDEYKQKIISGALVVPEDPKAVK